jgi:polyhydroxyalkanoate synthesis regulator phasin
MLACPGLANAGEMDVLVQKLVEKGILTPYEAQIVMDETKQEVAKQNAKGTNEAIPSWIQTTRIKGDLRLRYQTQQREAGTTRNRGRVRYRLGVETKPNDRFLVGAGLSSAEKSSTTDDARSTNQTMQNSFDRGDIRLDYAWGEYKPSSAYRVIGGKYNALGKDYLWYTTDMLWDSDINQEGASTHLDIPGVLAGDAFLNAGYWALDESSSAASDPGMYYGQAGMTFSPDPVQIKFAGTFYGLQGDDTGSVLDGRASGNTLHNGKYAYDFSKIFVGSAEAVYNWPAETSSPVKMAGIFGDYVVNPDPSKDNTGYAAGLKFGHPKVGAVRGDWQGKYQYVSLSRDAWLDSFPDSDRYSGNTNIRGHELILDIGLAKNISLGLDYYSSEVLKGTRLAEHVFQADINMKF